MQILHSYQPTIDDLAASVAQWDQYKLKPGEKCPGLTWRMLGVDADGVYEECTGAHNHKQPRAEWCPRTLMLDRRWDSTFQRSMYKYLWALRAGIDAYPDELRQRAATLRAEGFEEAAESSEREADRQEANQSHHERPISGASEPNKRKVRARLTGMLADE